MKRFMFLSVLLLLASFLATGCGKGEEKAGETSTEKRIEKKEEVESLYLTEKEVKAFIKAFPVFAEITRKKGEEVEPLTEREDLVSGVRFAGALKEYQEEIDAALKDYGFTLESFSAVHVKIMGAFVYGQMQGATEEMKKLLDNPNIPEEQKEEIRKSLKETEESEEAKASKKNWEIVKKYKSEIENLFKEE
jgi:hypothetical protein